ncbi:MAG: hypothetical protein GWP08_13985, partial [Nitrospiraceae bacterium]|nr:hypothetical protein [Nitrospiraceae bacterium]
EGEGEGEIVEQPVGGWFEVGERLELRVGLSGMVGEVSYQWVKDGSEIVGATGAVFEVASLSVSDAGWYQCFVADEAKTLYATAPVYVQVFAVGALPVAGAAGVCLAAMCVVLAGAFRRRR